jgi:hypothetical protein
MATWRYAEMAGALVGPNKIEVCLVVDLANPGLETR